MAERDKREQLVSGLQILRTWCAVSPDFGKGLSIDDCHKAVEWLDDALELLNEQEPRVLTPVEVMLAESVWLEDIDKEKVIHGLRCSSGGGKHWFVVSSMEAVSAMDADYGVRWRCWTSEPTKAQREATPWN